MKIVEYDEVDPLGVLHLNLLSLGYALTPEKVALIRRLDPRPFPFLAVYAVEEGVVAGQVGVYRLPMVSTQGREEVGGICAVCTHPAFSKRGVATALLEEAHSRMRRAGLRFSTLGTARHRVAHALYLRQGYEEVVAFTSAFAASAVIGATAGLRAEMAGPQRLHLAEQLFDRLSAGRLGFAWRHPSFFQAQVAAGEMGVDDLWLVWDEAELAGYAHAKVVETVLVVEDLILAETVNPGQALEALAREAGATYIQVKVSQPSQLASLRQAGFQIAQPHWSAFMVKPLALGVTVRPTLQDCSANNRREGA